MTDRKLHDGREDGLRPLVSLDLDSVESFSDLLEAMSETAFSGRSAGEAARILTEMFSDPDCGVVMTISGAMTVAKQGRIICELIERGCVQAIVATGALIAHGLTESIGLTHYRTDPNQSDEELFDKGYNRIYDTLEMEANSVIRMPAQESFAALTNTMSRSSFLHLPIVSWGWTLQRLPLSRR